MSTGRGELPHRGPTASRDPLVLGIALALLAAQLLTRSNFLIEDAFIAFRYARNWAEFGAPMWNPGEEPPIEGHSTILWVALLRWAWAFGFSLPASSLILGGLFGGLTVARLHRFLLVDVGLRRTAAALGVFALVLHPPFVVWCSGGLETSLQAWCMLTLFAELLRRGTGPDLRAGIAAGLAAGGLDLTRPEGFVWVLGLAGAAWLGTRLRPVEARPGLRRWSLFLGVHLLTLALLLAWRQSVHHAWLPNTVAAKAGLSGEVLRRGLACTTSWALLTLTPLAVLVMAPFGLRGPRRAPLAACLVVLLGGIAYNTAVGGDWMPYFRFMAPLGPFVAAALALSLGHLPSRGALAPGLPLALLGALPLAGEFKHGIVPQPLLERVYFRSFAGGEYRSERDQFKRSAQNLESFRAIGRALKVLAEPGDSIVMGAIGAVGWESELVVLDRNGLVDPEIARLPPSGEARSAGHDRRVPRAWFLEREPTFLQALIVPESAIDEESASFQAAVRVCARQVFGQDPEGEAPLRRAVIPEVRRVPPEVDFPAGMALMLWRRTDDTERAVEFWRRYGY
jgi:arabinofuranosyltransferase